jgi:Carboxypeptidase regulatory-like domain
MKRSYVVRLVWLLLLLVFSTRNTTAQEITGSITGVVADSSGALIPGVKVTVTNTGTNVSKEVVTGASGTYPTSDLRAHSRILMAG